MKGSVDVGILLSKENLDFSQYEVSRVFSSAETETSDNLIILKNVQRSALNENLAKLSYGKAAFELLAHEDSWDDMLRRVEAADITQFAFPDESYKVDSNRIGNTHQSTDRGLLAGLTNTTGELQVDVENPDATFIHLKGEKHTYGRRIWEQTEPFTDRRNDELPASHPTGMPPRLARGLVNVAQPDTAVLDPFCGAGGLLIEAGLLGYETHGIDYDSRMVDRAEENLAAFDIDGETVHGDALEEDWPHDVIVTDVPYGKNSSTSQDAEELFAAFMDRAKDKGVKRIAACYPAAEAFDAVVDAVDGEAPRFDFYVNSSLTRRVAVLEVA